MLVIFTGISESYHHDNKIVIRTKLINYTADLPVHAVKVAADADVVSSNHTLDVVEVLCE